MPLPRIILVASWTLFLLVWALMGPSAKKNVHVQPARARRAYTLPLLAGILLMMVLPAYHGPLAILFHPILARTSPLAWTGAGAAALGFAIALWARITLGRNWSGVVTLKADHELVTSGPYATIRHPIYTAILLLFLGLALSIATPGALLGIACIFWSCWVKLKQEEALMLGQFPESYPAYMARTHRLVPHLL